MVRKQDNEFYEICLEAIEARFDQCKAILFEKRLIESEQFFISYFATASHSLSRTFEELMYSYLHTHAYVELMKLVEGYCNDYN